MIDQKRSENIWFKNDCFFNKNCLENEKLKEFFLEHIINIFADSENNKHKICFFREFTGKVLSYLSIETYLVLERVSKAVKACINEYWTSLVPDEKFNHTWSGAFFNCNPTENLNKNDCLMHRSLFFYYNKRKKICDQYEWYLSEKNRIDASQIKGIFLENYLKYLTCWTDLVNLQGSLGAYNSNLCIYFKKDSLERSWDISHLYERVVVNKSEESVEMIELNTSEFEFDLRELDFDLHDASQVFNPKEVWKNFFYSFNQRANRPPLLKEVMLEGLSRLAAYQFQRTKIKELFIKDCPSLPLRFQLFSSWVLLNYSVQGSGVEASILAQKILNSPAYLDEKIVLTHLALTAAAKEDYRALEKYCFKVIINKQLLNSKEGLDFWINKFKKYYSIYPPIPIFHAYASLIGDLFGKTFAKEEIETPFNEGIKAYEAKNMRIPGEVWVIKALMKACFLEWKEAKQAINQALLTFNTHTLDIEEVPSGVWELNARIELALGEKAAAIHCIRKMLKTQVIPSRINKFFEDWKTGSTTIFSKDQILSLTLFE